MRDLHRLLTEDGLAGVPVLATSAVTPDGARELREFLVSTVAAHRARTARVSADLDLMATRIAPLVPQRRSGRRCGTVSDSCGPHSPRPPASRRWSTQLAGRMNDGPRRRWLAAAALVGKTAARPIAPLGDRAVERPA